MSKPLFIRFIIILSLVPWLVAIFFQARPWIHILQLEGYKGKEYLNWLKEKYQKIFTTLSVGAFLFIILIGTSLHWAPLKTGIKLWSLIICWTVLQIFLFIKCPKTTAKKELVFTPRVLRLLASLKIVIALEALVILWVSFFPLNSSPDWLQAELTSSAWLFALLQLTSLLIALNVWLANEMVNPIEEHIKNKYFKEAQAIVKHHPSLKIIGITGSYGKTSTKFILNSILSSTYTTLMTPESYNTPMGICKVIRGDLKSFHQFFIVEMGARYVGDIAEICRLTPPQMGIITAIGPQHLETFGSMEAIISTKGELWDALPPDGIAVINQDNDYCRQLADRLSCKCLRFGLAPGEGKTVWVERMSSGPEGTSFILNTANADKIKIQTQLLGKHNIYNILAACCAALYYNVSLNNIARAVARLQPVPHRLQLVKGEGGVCVIDDAFNSNPAGAKAALEVLKSFSSRRKFLITPGMVELGEEEFKQNKQFGQLAAESCDFIILVGPQRTIPIAQGLKEAGFPENNLFVAKNLNVARQTMAKLIKSGDVVLFENDLPDTYNE